MIVSESRRTDIPSYYSEWFIRRLQAGYVYVKNPMNIKQVSKIPLNREVVDCIVFWTKNPEPMISKLEIIDKMGYQYYFQFTITPYNNSVETSIGDKQKILDTFCFLSKMIGNERVI